MNVLLRYSLPLQHSSDRRRHFGLGLWLLGLSATVLILACRHGQSHQLSSQSLLALYGMVLTLIWGIVPAGSLLLAIDSQRLRIPGGIRQAFASLPGFALLCIVPAVVAFSLAGLAAWISIPALALAISLGLCLTWAPRWCLILFCLSPSMVEILLYRGVLAAWTQADVVRILYAGWMLLTGLAAGLAWFYLRHGMPDKGLQAPMIIASRQSGSHWWVASSRWQLSQSGSWLQPLVRLKDRGPQRTTNDLRILLGGLLRPLQWTYYLKLAALISIYPLLLLAMSVGAGKGLHWQALRIEHVSDFNWGWMTGVLTSALPGLTLMLGFVLPANLRSRWTDYSHDLAMLALLPGAGPASQQRRTLAQVLLWNKPVWWLSASLLLGLVCMLCWPEQAGWLAICLLGLLSAYLTGIAASLHIISLAPTWSYPARWLIGLGLLLLLSLDCMVPIMMATANHHTTHAWWQPLLIADLGAQLLTCAFMGQLAWRYWQRVKALPHPFLAH